MEKHDLLKLTDDELLEKKKELKKSKITHAVIIGFLAGIIVFGFVSWGLSAKRNVGFIIPMLFPIFAIYRMVKNGRKNKPLEEVLKERGFS